MDFLNKARSLKVKDIAVFDVVGTAVVSVGIGVAAHKMIGGDSHWAALSVIIFAILILAAIVIHWALGVPTMGNAYLGITTKEEVMAARRERGEIVGQI